MDPLVSLHYYAPVCAAINLAVIPFTEGLSNFLPLVLLTSHSHIQGLAPFYALPALGPFILLTNAGVAFLLNIAAVFLVGAGSGLILTLAGVFKVCEHDFYLNVCSHIWLGHQDILLITGSVLIFGKPITPLQVLGSSELIVRPS